MVDGLRAYNMQIQFYIWCSKAVAFTKKEKLEPVLFTQLIHIKRLRSLYKSEFEFRLEIVSTSKSCSDAGSETVFEHDSDTRTVVQECCKGDDESLWERENLIPRHPKTH